MHASKKFRSCQLQGKIIAEGPKEGGKDKKPGQAVETIYGDEQKKEEKKGGHADTFGEEKKNGRRKTASNCHSYLGEASLLEGVSTSCGNPLKCFYPRLVLR